jgi:uncharacterized membrane protein
MLVDLIVSLIVIGVVVVMGVLGYFIDKTAEPAERKRQGKGA